MFQVGDRIAHPMHGAGIVREIVQQRVDGQDCSFYSVEMTTGSMRVLVPCAPCSGLAVRALVTAEEAEALLARIPELDDSNIQNWNQRYRENMLKMKSGDLLQVAEVIKSLTARDRKRGLSTGERKLLTCARSNLLSELSMTLEAELKDVEAWLDRALK